MKKIINHLIKKIRFEGLISISRIPFNRCMEIFNTFYLMLKIKKLRKTYTLESLIDFVFRTNKGIIKPMQMQSEILALLSLIKVSKPNYILEIGTAKGGTLFLFSRVAAKNALLLSIDLPGWLYIGCGYPKWKSNLYKSFALPNQKIFLIHNNSHQKTSLAQVKKILKDNKLDLLFIDGDHSYSGVKKDFEIYSPLVKKNGIIVFHDILNHPLSVKLKMGVYKFWNEIKERYTYKEYVDNKAAIGIGILLGKKEYYE